MKAQRCLPDCVKNCMHSLTDWYYLARVVSGACQEPGHSFPRHQHLQVIICKSVLTFDSTAWILWHQHVINTHCKCCLPPLDKPVTPLVESWQRAQQSILMQTSISNDDVLSTKPHASLTQQGCDPSAGGLAAQSRCSPHSHSLLGTPRPPAASHCSGTEDGGSCTG